MEGFRGANTDYQAQEGKLNADGLVEDNIGNMDGTGSKTRSKSGKKAPQFWKRRNIFTLTTWHHIGGTTIPCQNALVLGNRDVCWGTNYDIKFARGEALTPR